MAAEMTVGMNIAPGGEGGLFATCSTCSSTITPVIIIWNEDLDTKVMANCAAKFFAASEHCFWASGRNCGSDDACKSGCWSIINPDFWRRVFSDFITLLLRVGYMCKRAIWYYYLGHIVTTFLFIKYSCISRSDILQNVPQTYIWHSNCFISMGFHWI